MFNYNPLWETMREKQISTYALLKDYGLSKGTLDSLKQGRNVTMQTIDWLCQVLEVPVEKVVHVELDDTKIKPEQKLRASVYRENMKNQKKKDIQKTGAKK